MSIPSWKFLKSSAHSNHSPYCFRFFVPLLVRQRYFCRIEKCSMFIMDQFEYHFTESANSSIEKCIPWQTKWATLNHWMEMSQWRAPKTVFDLMTWVYIEISALSQYIFYDFGDRTTEEFVWISKHAQIIFMYTLLNQVYWTLGRSLCACVCACICVDVNAMEKQRKYAVLIYRCVCVHDTRAISVVCICICILIHAVIIIINRWFRLLKFQRAEHWTIHTRWA